MTFKKIINQNKIGIIIGAILWFLYNGNQTIIHYLNQFFPFDILWNGSQPNSIGFLTFLLIFMSLGLFVNSMRFRKGLNTSSKILLVIIIIWGSTYFMNKYIPDPRPETTTIEGLNGFPSSHAAVTFAIVPWLTGPIYYIGLGIALFVSYSRLLSGQHYAHQVIFGALFGYFVSWYLKNKIFKKKR